MSPPSFNQGSLLLWADHGPDGATWPKVHAHVLGSIHSDIVTAVI